MSYSSFWGFCALSLLLLVYGGYSLYRVGWKRAQKSMKRGNRILLYGTAAVWFAAVIAGIVMMLVDVEAPAVHGMGLIVLLVAFALYGQLRRGAQQTPDNEE